MAKDVLYSNENAELYQDDEDGYIYLNYKQYDITIKVMSAEDWARLMRHPNSKGLVVFVEGGMVQETLDLKGLGVSRWVVDYDNTSNDGSCPVCGDTTNKDEDDDTQYCSNCEWSANMDRSEVAQLTYIRNQF